MLQLIVHKPIVSVLTLDSTIILTSLVLSNVSPDKISVQYQSSANNPVLIYYGVKVKTLDGILSVLRKSGLLDFDSNLTPQQQDEIFIYQSLVENQLLDVLLYIHVINPENFKSLTSLFYQLVPFYSRHLFASTYLSNINKRLSKYKVLDKSILKKQAKESFASLQNLLGNKLFFLGEKPTSLDAIVYSHLRVHALPVLNDPMLCTLLGFEFTGLNAYIERVHNLTKNHPFFNPLPVMNHGLFEWVTDLVKLGEMNEERKEAIYGHGFGIGACSIFAVYAIHHVIKLSY